MRLLALIAGSLIAILLSSGLYIIISEQQVLKRQIDSRGQSLAATAADFSIETMLIRDYSLMETYAEEMLQAQNDVQHVRVFDENSKVVVDVGELRSEEAGSYYTAEVSILGELVGVVEVGLSSSEMQELLDRRVYLLSAVLASVVLGIGLFIYWLISITQNLQEREQSLQESNAEVTALNQELKDNQAQLLQSEKMASLGTLAAGVAHEINNPLGFVSSNLRTMIDYYKTMKPVLDSAAEQQQDTELEYIAEDVEPLLQESLEGAERVAKIVSSLKQFAHPGDLEGSALYDLNECVESTLELVWNELKYRVTVEKSLAELPKLQGNRSQISQVLTNLLVNAAQAIEDRGEVRIETLPQNGGALIRISDTGSGIEPENLKHLFTPFFTTKDVGKGTGLGLSISHGIVEKQGGTIDVESTLGQGTTFTLWLPLKAPQIDSTETV